MSGRYVVVQLDPTGLDPLALNLRSKGVGVGVRDPQLTIEY